MSNPPQNFGELNSPPQKKHQNKRYLLKKQKILFPTLKKLLNVEISIMNIKLQNLKIKGELGIF